MQFKVYRDCDSRRLRKVVVELYKWDGSLLNRCRLFAVPLFNFARRLKRRQDLMLKQASVMQEGSRGWVNPTEPTPPPDPRL